MTTGERIPNSLASDVYGRVRPYVNVETDACAYFRRDVLRARDWSAALVSEELSPPEAELVAAACRRHGYAKAYALDIDHFESESFLEIDLDGESLTRVEAAFVTPSYLIVETNERFMIVSDSDYYWSIAGSAAFLHDVFDKPVEAINRDFIEATRPYRHGASRIGPVLSRIAAEAVDDFLPTA